MTKTGIIVNIIMVTVVALGTFFYFKSAEKRIAYVKITKLYDEFVMKKELSGKYENIQKTRQNFLDSLELELRLIGKKIENTDKPDQGTIAEFESRKENYLMKKKQFEEDNTATVNQYTEQIMKQLNQYVEVYGKEQHYTYILGADGSGVIMHADESLDITDELVKYVNLKYKGQ